MSNQRLTDVMIGTLVIGAVAVLVAAFILTKGWNKRQFDLYMRTESARELNSDTQVLLQSLPIGEVKAVAPQVDSLTGRLRFIVHLRIDQEYQDGTELRLPLGTHADMETPRDDGHILICQVSMRGDFITGGMFPTQDKRTFLARVSAENGDLRTWW